MSNAKLREAIDETISILNRYVWFPEKNQDVLIATWIASTYFHQKYAHFGILWVTAPDMRMGKSTALRIVANLSFNSEGAARFGTSAAALFRSCAGATVVIDEYEQIPKLAKAELDSIFRGGYEAGAMFTKTVEVKRKVAGQGTMQSWEKQHYPIYGPKAVGSIAEQPKTFRDRCFIIVMERATEDKPVLNLNDMNHKTMLTTLKGKLTEAAKASRDQVVAEYRPMLESRPPELSFMQDARLKDVSLGLLAVARVAGYEEQLIDALKDQLELREGTQDDNAEQMEDLVEAIESYLISYPGGGKIRARELSNYAPQKSSLKDSQQMGFLLGRLKAKKTKPKNVMHYEITRAFLEQVKAKL